MLLRCDWCGLRCCGVLLCLVLCLCVFVVFYGFVIELLMFCVVLSCSDMSGFEFVLHVLWLV